MKRKLLAIVSIAGIALCHESAIAQTNVTVYGLVDAAVEYSSQGGGTLLRLQSGSYQGSRLGFKGTEDLGGGLSAIFTLENGFATDTGIQLQGGRLFGRQAFVGLKNAFGSVMLGRQYSPYYLALVQQDAFQYTMAGGIPALALTRGATRTTGSLLGVWEALGRVNNSIVYDSPVIGGFSSRLMYGLGEVAGNQSAGRVLGGQVRYNRGPLDLNASLTNGRDPFDIGARTARTLGGSYGFGPVRLYAGYLRETNNVAATAGAATTKSVLELYNLGARYALTPKATLVGQVDRIRDRSDGLAVSKDATAFSIGAEYSLSVRTIVYSSIGAVGNRNGSGYSWGSGTALGGPVTGDPRAKTANIGIRHTF